MEFSVIFDENFFKIFKARWLKTKEILLLLVNLDELIRQGLIKITTALTTIPKDGDYFIFVKDIGSWKKDFIDWKKRKNGNILESFTTFKVCGTRQINCIYLSSDSSDLKKRCFYLINDQTYILTHYRSEEEKDKDKIQSKVPADGNATETLLAKKTKKQKLSSQKSPKSEFTKEPSINNNFQCIEYSSAANLDFAFPHKHMKIVDFAPNSVLVNTTSKILIIIQSYLNFQNLKMLENQIRIKFSDDIFMPCTVLNASTLSSIIPYGHQKEVILEIFIGKESVSICNENLKLRYIEASSFVNKNVIINQNENQNNNLSESKKNKKDSLIFEMSADVLQKKIHQLFNEMKSIAIFYNNGKTLIGCLTSGNPPYSGDSTPPIFDESVLYAEMEKMLKELEEIEKNWGTNKLNLIYKQDNDGYDIIHYISARDYSNLLDLFSKHKIKLCELSSDKLTPYEIAAGKWNFNTLTKLIELIDDRDNQEILIYSKCNKDDVEMKHMLNLNLENSLEKEKIFYNLDILRSAFNLALDFADKNKITINNSNTNNKFCLNGELNVIELLLKQIRIQLTVNSTSHHIIRAINKNLKNSDEKNENTHQRLFSDDENQNIMMIQKYIRGWLRRSKYNGMKNVVNKLKERCKILFEGKEKFCNFKMAIVKIQKKFRRWMKNKTTSNEEN